MFSTPYKIYQLLHYLCIADLFYSSPATVKLNVPFIYFYKISISFFLFARQSKSKLAWEAYAEVIAL